MSDRGLSIYPPSTALRSHNAKCAWLCFFILDDKSRIQTANFLICRKPASVLREPSVQVTQLLIRSVQIQGFGMIVGKLWRDIITFGCMFWRFVIGSNPLRSC
jgi:hypothetical protein